MFFKKKAPALPTKLEMLHAALYEAEVRLIEQEAKADDARICSLQHEAHADQMKVTIERLNQQIGDLAPKQPMLSDPGHSDVWVDDMLPGQGERRQFWKVGS